MVRAVIDGVHPCAVRGKLIPHLLMDQSQRVLGEVPAGYPRLVGDHDHRQPCVAEHGDRLCGAREHAKVPRSPAVVDIFGDGAVPIEEHGSVQHGPAP